MHYQHNQLTNNFRKSTIIPRMLNISVNALGDLETPTSLDYCHIIFLYCRGNLLDNNTHLVLFIYRFTYNK